MPRVEATFHGQTYDMTPEVAEVGWRFGQRLPNQFGAAMAPAAGLIALRNGPRHGHKYRVYAPASQVDVTPGPEVRIYDDDDTLLCKGRSSGVLNALPNSRQFTASMPFVGSLGYLSQFGERVFARLDGLQAASAVWDLVLDDIGYTGPRRTQSAATNLSAGRVNRSALLGTNRQRAALLDAARTLAQAEVGRIYDDLRSGEIVFENRRQRAQLWATTNRYFITPGNGSIQQAQVGSVLESIINIVSSTGDSYQSQGLQNLDFLPAVPSNTTFAIEPDATRNGQPKELVFNADASDGIEFIQSWTFPVRGTHYTYTVAAPDGDVIIDRSALSVIWRVPNPTGVNQVLTFINQQGEPFKVALRERISSRSQASISEYGERVVTYPADLVTNREEVRDHLEWAVRLHDGIGPDGKSVDPVRQVDVRINKNDVGNDGFKNIGVSDLVVLTEPELGLTNAPFWVDEAAHSLQVDGQRHTINLRLTDARATTMWPIEGSQFGYNTRIGF